MRVTAIFVKISPLIMAAFAILVMSSMLGEAGDPAAPEITMSAAPGAADDEPVLTRHQKVFGGHDAPPGAFPFQVALIFSDAIKGQEINRLRCGGSLISDTWVLTAAHCVTDENNGQIFAPTDFHVYAGSVNFTNGDRIPVKSVYRHPLYNADFTDNDVALLKLERALKKEVKVSKINLIDATRASTLEAVGRELTIVGWGATEQSLLSRNLRYTSIKIVDHAECRSNILQDRSANLDHSKLMKALSRLFWLDESKVKDVHDAIVANAGQIVNDNMICAGDPNPAPGAEFVHDACQGDSGGPLITKAGDKWIQIGIVSWGEGCGIPKLHGVYTRLGNYIEWIKSIVID
jgi:secreted trypsin-like serine protease